jgi:hypothetical protein
VVDTPAEPPAEIPATVAPGIASEPQIAAVEPAATPEAIESEPEVPVPPLAAELAAEFGGGTDRLMGEDFDDEDDYDEDDEDEGAPLEPESALVAPELAPPVEVRPFTAAEFPRICWVVVDRASELMTRPLGEFNNIGRVPEDERQEITLPIFENHRVARRYTPSHHHRPLKMPAHLLDSTRSYLLRKGITRLLVGKQVYALNGEVAEAVAHRESEPFETTTE